MQRFNLLGSTRGRYLAFGLMYISEGIPFGFTSVAMVAVMRTEGISIFQIGAFSAALLVPWSFKWAWAPVIDLVKLHRFGGRRAWILFCTAMMIVTLVVTALVDFHNNFNLLIAMVVLNNFFCATQDVAIDSLAVSTLRDNERAAGNGFMFAGQFFGIGLGGGGAIYVFGRWGFDVTLMYISGALFLNLLFILFFIRDPGVVHGVIAKGGDVLLRVREEIVKFVRELYTSFLMSGNGPRIGLLFAALPVGSMALNYSILGTIKVDIGLTQSQNAEISIYNTIAAGIGCLVGGWLAQRFGVKRMLAVFLAATAVPTAGLAMQIEAVGLEQLALRDFYAVIIAHGAIYGMTFGAHKAVFMGMTNPAVGATQFTAFMAMGNLAIVYSNLWQGYVAQGHGYSAVLYLDALFMLVPLTLIPFLKDREPTAVPALA
jgi:PAT family beta-lactamase induction signal transducer AmpG